MRAKGPRQREGEDGGHRHHQDAGDHDQRTAPPPAIPGAEQRQDGEWPGREFHGRGDAEHHTGRERTSSLRQHHGEQHEGDDRDVVATRGQRERGQGEDDEHLNGPDFAAAGSPAQVEGHRRHRQRGEAEEDTGIAQLAVGPDVARDAGHRQDGEVRQEAGVVGLTRRVVRHLVMEALDLPIGVRPLDQVLTAHLDRGHLGLEVGAGNALEAPQDLEAHGNGQGAGEDTGGDDDSGHPGPVVLACRQGGPPVTAAPTGSSHHHGEHDRGQGTDGEGRQRHAAPDLVERVLRRVDGDHGEDGAAEVEEGVARLGRDPRQGRPGALPGRRQRRSGSGAAHRCGA